MLIKNPILIYKKIMVFSIKEDNFTSCLLPHKFLISYLKVIFFMQESTESAAKKGIVGHFTFLLLTLMLHEMVSNVSDKRFLSTQTAEGAEILALSSPE